MVVYIKRKRVVVGIAAVVLILAAAAFAYKADLLNFRQDVRVLRKTGMLAALEIKHAVMGTDEKPGYVPILMYHSINDSPVGEPSFTVDTKDFEKQIAYLADNGYTPIDFDALKDAGQYKKPILLTFDDGYEDNYDKAYPILKKYDMKATIFIVSEYIGSPGYLNEDEMREMGDIISFQSHTKSHSPLTDLTEPVLEQELSDSREAISKITGKNVNVLSYPNGAYNEAVIKAAGRYYSWAVTTDFGYYYSGSPKLKLRRIAVLNSETMKDFIGKVR